jgi:5-methylcytosine-specific restriction endonuclease McrA
MAAEADSASAPRRQCDVTRSANAKARKARTCEQCGKTFTEGHLSAKQVASGHRQRFCSRACTADSVRIYASKAEAKREAWKRKRAAPIERQCATCANPTTRPIYCSSTCCIEGQRRRKQASHKHRTFQCMVCGADHTPKYGDKSTAYCSAGCGRVAANRQRIASGQKASSRKARKLKQRGVSVEHVNPLKVLERDRWTCQLCGVKTPSRLRGTFDDRAPELDHIIPIAQGGEHSYRNAQCACRKCNIAKGSKPKGQMLLFG